MHEVRCLKMDFSIVGMRGVPTGVVADQATFYIEQLPCSMDSSICKIVAESPRYQSRIVLHQQSTPQ